MRWPWSKRFEERGSFTPIGSISDLARYVSSTFGESSAGVKVSEEAAMLFPPYASCIRVLSRSIAQMPLLLKRRMDDGGAEEAREHPVFDLINTQPNMDISSYEWRNTSEFHRNGWGNCYTRIVRGRLSMPRSLEIMMPEDTSLHKMGDGSYVYHWYPDEEAKRARKPRVLPSNDVIHLKFQSFDGRSGRSPIQWFLRELIGTALALQTNAGKFFRNGARPSGVLETEVEVNRLERFSEAFFEEFAGLNNAGGTPILPKGFSYKPHMINPEDSQADQTYRTLWQMCCGHFQVPPHLVMELSHNTFTNASEMDTAFAKYTIGPIVAMWEQELNRKLLGTRERRRLFFDFDDDVFLRMNMLDRYSANNLAVQGGWKTRNEVRMKEKMGKLDGLDEIVLPTNLAGGSDDMNDQGTSGQTGA